MQIKEIKKDEEFAQTYGLIAKTYEDLSREDFSKNFSDLQKNGHKFAAVFSGHDCTGFINIRISDKLRYGKSLEIEDFIADKTAENALITWAEAQAKNSGCKNIIGNFETKRIESHKIFSREGFVLDGFFFRKKI